MKKVLFVCIHNSARSQMAEELLRKYGGSDFIVESAGLEPGVINQTVANILLQEEQIDIRDKTTNSVFDFFKQGKIFHYVVTVCDSEAAEKCPIFPGINQMIHWSFKDPSNLSGTQEDQVDQIIQIKNEIKDKILELIKIVKG